MDIPPPNPRKLLDHWMEWEKGEMPPGELMKQFKMGGIRDLLETVIAAEDAADALGAAEGETVGDLLDS